MKGEAAVVIGVDAHKRTHTLVAADELGREVATKTLAATADGHLAAIGWAARWPTRRWALEDCRHLTRTLEAALLRVGEQVLRVPTQMMAGVRRSARTRGKSDAIDALAIARAAWREPDLPVAQLDGPSRQVRLLVDHRDDLVAERTRLQSRIRWHLHEIAPDLDVPARGLKLQHVVERVATRLADLDGLIAAICREQLDRVRELNRRINELERDITPLIRALAPNAAEHPRLRRADRRQARRRDGRRHPLSIKERLRPLERHRTPTCQLGQHDQVPSQPRRQPPSQRRPTPHRSHPSSRLAPGPRLHHQTHQTGQHQDRGAPPPAPPTLRRRLPHPAHRRTRRPTRSRHPHSDLT
jgi:transposase